MDGVGIISRPAGPAPARDRGAVRSPGTPFAQAHAGDGRAREKLIAQFLPLARRLARRYQRTSEPMDDLLQVASLGLVKAVDRFDPARGVAFSSFAVPTILGELKRHFRDTSWAVHVPRALHEQALKVERTATELEGRLGRSVKTREVADELGISLEDALAAMEAAGAYDALSMDAPIQTGDGEHCGLVESLGHDDGALALVDERATVMSCMAHLPPRDRRILQMRFGQDLTQTQIAERVGVSQMQVSRIIRRSLARLRELAEPEQAAISRPGRGAAARA